MTKPEALDALLAVFGRYYNVNRETPAAPFAAEAEFHLHNENYILIKSAKYAEQDSNEYVFFALTDNLTPAVFEELKEKAWDEGLSRAKIGENHRNSDVALYIITDRLDPETVKPLRKSRLSKTYRFGFRGYSHFRVLALDLGAKRYAHNYMGDILARNVHIVFPDAVEQRR